MNQILKVHMEIEKNGNTYVLEMPVGAPLGEVYDVVHEMLAGIVEMSREAMEKARQTAETAVKETEQ